LTPISNAYLSAASSSKNAEVLSRMTEDAQYALAALSREIRIAASNPAQPNRADTARRNPLTSPFAIRGCDETFTDVQTAPSAAALTCPHTGRSLGPHSISIGYEADRYNTIPKTNGDPTSCTGAGLTLATPAVTAADGSSVAAQVYEAENRFYVATSTRNPRPSLYCKGSNASPQALVENVENLQLSYAVTAVPNTTTIAGYLSAWALENDATALSSLTQAQRWALVRAIRVCVVMRSDESLYSDPTAAQYVDCAGELVTPSDRRMRRSFQTTVLIRNR
jgi:hypothetical protein